MPKITQIHARQILDSRGNPTVEVDVELSDGSTGRASVPSGASTGAHEAVELRDNDPDVYNGKGVEKAVEHVNTEIAQFLQDNDPLDQLTIDSEMILRDGTKNAGRLGANAILGVSLAVSKATANSLKIPYYAYIHQLYQSVIAKMCSDKPLGQVGHKIGLPRAMFNIMNGGAHTDWQSTDIQEFMIVPLTAQSFEEQLRWGTEIYHQLEHVLKNKGYNTLVGDEGGFAPQVKNDQEALELILTAIDQAGYSAGDQIGIAIDVAASQFWHDKKYKLPIQKQTHTTDELIDIWADWVRQYPIVSLEDPLAEDDWQGWQDITWQLGEKLQIVGDDLLVTNLERINKAIEQESCNCLLMKLNQIGTLTESVEAICAAQQAGWGVVVSHRSGETEDDSIADIVVGTNAGQIKAGAPSRGERLVKYNQLLRIEEELDKKF
jgi:enolase